MYYDKRIRYIDYLENGEKQRNCGYIKITVTGGRLLLEMQIKGLYATDDVASEVMLEGAGIESRIGSVSIHQGNGSFCWEIQDQAHQGEEILLNERLNYGHLERIVVHLSSRRSLHCIWRELQTAKPAVTERAAENAAREQALRPGETMRSEEQEPGPEEAMQSEGQKLGPEEVVRLEEQKLEPEQAMWTGAQEPGPEETMRSEEQESEPEKAIWTGGQSMLEAALGISNEQGAAESYIYSEQEGRVTQKEVISQQGNTAEEEAISQQGSAIPGRTARREELFAAKTSVESQPPKQEELHTAETQRTVSQEPPTMPMSEEKWQQLQRIYPHIRPFQDEREYLSLRPEDFVILRTNSYRLVQNSFLLHGFYNYKHLILTHVSQKNARQYYIGVPGNFYEKEKQVAIMYGFDSFECRQEPAGEGDFGYYMIRV
ncbi:MAG: hypothetical protein K2H45_03030, partial [Acetatifactor sp.]|nr:hypothetical protein [Acetatifactor sp.]